MPAPKNVPASTVDSDSDKEALSLGSGKTREQIASDARTREHNRDQQFKDHFEHISIVGIYIAAATVFVIGLIVAFHMASPKKWQWLDGEQIASLKGLFTGGVLAGIIATHFKKRF